MASRVSRLWVNESRLLLQSGSWTCGAQEATRGQAPGKDRTLVVGCARRSGALRAGSLEDSYARAPSICGGGPSIRSGFSDSLCLRSFLTTPPHRPRILSLDGYGIGGPIVAAPPKRSPCVSATPTKNRGYHRLVRPSVALAAGSHPWSVSQTKRDEEWNLCAVQRLRCPGITEAAVK